MNKKFELFIYLIKEIISKIKKLDKLYFVCPLYCFTLAIINKIKHKIIIFFKTPISLTPELAEEFIIKKLIIIVFLKNLPNNIDIKTLNVVLTLVYIILTNNDK